MKRDLIPRRVLFGNPERSAPAVSPDGRWLAWLAPHLGAMNIHVAPVESRAGAVAATARGGRGIRAFQWSRDSRWLLFLDDSGGDENDRLFGVEWPGAREACLAGGTGFRVRIEASSARHPSSLVIGSNRRDPSRFDPHLLHLPDGTLRLLRENASHAGFVYDWDLRPVLGVRYTDEGELVYEDLASGRAIVAAGPEDSATTQVLSLGRDGESLLVLDNRGRNTRALVRVMLAGGRADVLAEDPRCDAEGVLVDPLTGEPEAVAFYGAKRRWHALSPRAGESLRALESLGEIDVLSRSDDGGTWVVQRTGERSPHDYFLHDARTGGTLPLFPSRPAMLAHPGPPVECVDFPTRDGRIAPGYLVRASSECGPTVVLVHGGPWWRDHWGFDATRTWLADRGYHVLCVNFRGSTGFGKEWTNLGDREWGRAMQHDLEDALSWCVARGVADPARAAIFGTSYGGYSALAGAAFTPGLFACAVDVVGPSNLETLLSSVPPYWKPTLRRFRQRIGDDTTPEGRALLRERSPLHRAHEIRCPLLIAHGANDPRVRRAESDQIARAIRDRGGIVTYLLYPDEGHGLVRAENLISFHALAEQFLAEHLGGMAEPPGADLEVSSVELA